MSRPSAERDEPAPSGERRLAVLGYHKVGPPAPGGWETWYLVPMATFESHLAQLRDAGWEPVALDAVLAALDDPAVLPPRAALLTFDDGSPSVLHHALPAMEREGWPGAAFVPSDHVDASNRWEHSSEPPERTCSWAELRELGRRGVSVQSHAASHRTFAELAPGQVADEVRRSKVELEEGLGRPVTTLAYPYGDPGPDPHDTARGLRGAGYRAAFGYGGRPVTLPVADRFRVDRLAIGPEPDLPASLREP